MTPRRDLFTRLAVGIIFGYAIATFGFPLHFAVSSLVGLFYTAPALPPGGPPPRPDVFFLVQQLTTLAIVTISSIVAALSPTPLAAFQRLAFVLVPCIILLLFIQVSVLIFGD